MNLSHKNYNCCAICDDKIAYKGSDSVHKQRICPYCIIELTRRGLACYYDMASFTEWMEKENPQTIVRILTELNFRKCIYENPIDKLYDKIVEEAKANEHKAQKEEK